MEAYSSSIKKEIYTFTNSQCEFTYRNSYFKSHPGRYVVIEVQFQLRMGVETTPITYAELATKLGIAVGEKAPVAATRKAVLELRAAKPRNGLARKVRCRTCRVTRFLESCRQVQPEKLVRSRLMHQRLILSETAPRWFLRKIQS